MRTMADVRASARLFLALWPDSATRAALQRDSDAWHWPAQARRVPPERLHLTLHFIGAVPRTRLAELAKALAVDCEPMDLKLEHAEVWPGGIAVLRPAATPAPLAALHEALAGRLQAFALPVEARPFKPHLTLARRAAGASRPDSAAAIAWRASGYRLMESLPGGRGYETLARWA